MGLPVLSCLEDWPAQCLLSISSAAAGDTPWQFTGSLMRPHCSLVVLWEKEPFLPRHNLSFAERVGICMLGTLRNIAPNYWMLSTYCQGSFPIRLTNVRCKFLFSLKHNEVGFEMKSWHPVVLSDSWYQRSSSSEHCVFRTQDLKRKAELCLPWRFSVVGRNIFLVPQ